MRKFKYHNLGTPALQLLSMPLSNADSEKVFSLVRRVKIEFESPLLTVTLSTLIGCHFNRTANCCEMVQVDECLIS